MSEVQRVGSWIPLVDGTAHYPFDPRPEEVSVEAIAHHLSNLCRYNGGTKWFYPVAQHSVLITRWLQAERYHPIVQMHGLHHDDPEGLSGFGDVCGPVKDEAPLIKDLESLLWQRVVAPLFALGDDLPMIVHEADMRIRADEKAIVLNPSAMPWKANDPPLGIEIMKWTPEEAKAAYLQEHYRLVEEISNG
jgi:hypothetical protein